MMKICNLCQVMLDSWRFGLRNLNNIAENVFNAKFDLRRDDNYRGRNKTLPIIYNKITQVITIKLVLTLLFSVGCSLRSS